MLLVAGQIWRVWQRNVIPPGFSGRLELVSLLPACQDISVPIGPLRLSISLHPSWPMSKGTWPRLQIEIGAALPSSFPAVLLSAASSALSHICETAFRGRLRGSGPQALAAPGAAQKRRLARCTRPACNAGSAGDRNGIGPIQ